MNEQDAKDGQFPLEAYTAVYEWIGKWTEVARDPEQRIIAQSAYASLTAVGELVLDVMRQMPKGLASSPIQLEVQSKRVELPETREISRAVTRRMKTLRDS